MKQQAAGSAPPGTISVNNFAINWQTVKKALVVVALFCAAFQASLPDGVPGSPRALVIGIGLGSAAAAAGI
jgi:hypothetical protein